MSRIVMKESPDVDFYVVWSSAVDATVASGNREEITLQIEGDAAARLERADATGTSSLWVGLAGMRNDFPEEGSWEDDSYIYQQQGILTRAGVFEVSRREEGEDVSDLLTPFDDDSTPESARPQGTGLQPRI